MTLAASDRVLLKLRAGPASARQLSRALEYDSAALHRILRGLETAGIIEPVTRPRECSAWRLCPGVQVVHRAEEVIVTGNGLRAPTQGGSGLCRAMNAQGKPCRIRAAAQGLCFLHARLARSHLPL